MPEYSPRKKRLSPKAVHVDSAMGELEMGQEFSPEIHFLFVSTIILLAKCT